MKYDVIIIGSGPAGYTAAIYTSRAGLKTLLVQGMSPGGQLMTTTDVENYPGFKNPIKGPALMSEMEDQARNCGVEIVLDFVKDVDFTENKNIKIITGSNVFFSKTCIICTGAQSKWLGIESEDKFKGYGVSSCAVCDGIFFKNQDVVVVGGGNTALEEAIYLSKFTNKVTMIHRRDKFAGENTMQQRVFANPKISIIWNSLVVEIKGTENPKIVSSIVIQDNITKTISEINAAGVFIAIGHKPSTEIFAGKIELDDHLYIKTNSCATSVPGVFAAGDVCDVKYRQAITAAGDGCKAALEVQWYLERE